MSSFKLNEAEFNTKLSYAEMAFVDQERLKEAMNEKLFIDESDEVLNKSNSSNPNASENLKYESKVGTFELNKIHQKEEEGLAVKLIENSQILENHISVPKEEDFLPFNKSKYHISPKHPSPAYSINAAIKEFRLIYFDKNSKSISIQKYFDDYIRKREASLKGKYFLIIINSIGVSFIKFPEINSQTKKENLYCMRTVVSIDLFSVQETISTKQAVTIAIKPLYQSILI